ncbi:MAG: universal stress protein [Desulforhopalus sp.]
MFAHLSAGWRENHQKKIIDAGQQLNDAKKFLYTRGIKNTIHLLPRKKTADDIVVFAAEEKCSKIITGVTSRSKVGKILFGSTAH